MTREEKAQSIEALKEKFGQHDFFYVTDSSDLTVEQVNNFRRLCFAQGIEMRVVKNTLAIKALQQAAEEKGYTGILDAFKGTSAILFTNVSNTPAKVIQDFRKENPKPVLKAAYIDAAIYFGDDQLEALANLKSKEELIGEIIGLLQSPMSNLMSALQSGGNTIAGLLKTLESRGE
jgi:large subunit ribosomal protein L10